MEQPVVSTFANGVVHLRLARPTTGNAMDLSLIRAFGAAVSAIDAEATRAVLITATGRHFCVGGDLRGMAQADDKPGILREMATGLHDALRRLDELPAPVVIAVNGTAAGAGLSLAAAADILIASESSRFLMAYTAIGLSPDGGATHRLPRLIGLRLTQEMAYLNRTLTASEALVAGLVTRVVADEALEEQAMAIACTIAAGPTRAFARIRDLLARGSSPTLADQLDREADAIVASAGSSDAAEGIAAFLEQRPARFMGR